MAKKNRGKKPQGHYCKVCGERKANEKFSGKGHTAHICKSCQGLSAAQRSEMMAIQKIEGMAFRYLSENEIKWLRGKMNDSNEAVRQAAQEAHHIKFPHYERNQAKKGLTAFSLELYIHDLICNVWGDEVNVHSRVSMDDDGLVQLVNYDAPELEQKKQVQIEPKEARRFLKSVVQDMEAPFWNEDLSDNIAECDPYIDVLPEYRPDYGMSWGEDEAEVTNETESVQTASTKEPIWSLSLELNNGNDVQMCFYNQIHDAPVDLFWSLVEWFETDDYCENFSDETTGE